MELQKKFFRNKQPIPSPFVWVLGKCTLLQNSHIYSKKMIHRAPFRISPNNSGLDVTITIEKIKKFIFNQQTWHCSFLKKCSFFYPTEYGYNMNSNQNIMGYKMLTPRVINELETHSLVDTLKALANKIADI